MVPYHQDPEHAAHLQEAPRCQHIRMNGRRCGSPALRGENYCYFHDTIANPSGSYSLPFPEDATSLQYGVMMVIRMLISGHVEIKRCWALLYSLQIAQGQLEGVCRRAGRARRPDFRKDGPPAPGCRRSEERRRYQPSESGGCSHAAAERERFQRGTAGRRHSRGLSARSQVPGDGRAGARRQGKDGEGRWSAPATAAVGPR